MALSADAARDGRHIGKSYWLPVKASTTIHRGSLVMLDTTGHAAPASTTSAGYVVGVAVGAADNGSGADAAIQVEVQSGTFKVAGTNLGADDLGSLAYATDDDVLEDAGSLTVGHPAVGPIVQVDGANAWVEIDLNANSSRAVSS